MTLEKATIQRHIPSGGNPIKVLFNPNQYRLSKSNQFAEVVIPGLPAPLLQFGRGNAYVLSMQLFFDTYEQQEDVRNYTSQITELLEINEDLHAPPVCLFNWGKLNFVGVLERAEQTFTLFLSNGIPVRATMDISLKEFYQGGKEEAVKLQSANFAKRYVVRQKDTLSSIASQECGDPALWRPIAEENSIDDPLALQPGQTLIIPAIE